LDGTKVPGLHAVRELLSAGARRTKELWVAAEHRPNEGVEALAELARQRRVPVVPVERRSLDEMAGTTAHQGVLAWAEAVGPVPLDKLVRSAEPFLVVLDGVTDPGNLGSILRTSACTGVTGLVVPRHRSAPLTPAAVKAAAGAVEHVPVAVVPGIPAALAEMSRAGIWTVGLSPDGEADLWSTPVLDGPLALVLGSEGKGLSVLARHRCDVLARAHQVGPLASLNVSVAAGVACFEVARRRYVGA
jgi:23S rRNA (guanosine2251-2'-O)-methyltransferase